MKIGFDAKRAAQNRTGLGNYSRFVLQILSDFAPQNDYVLYIPNERKEQLLASVKGTFKKAYPAEGVWRKLRSLWRVWGITSDIQKDGLDIYHGLSNELPLNIRRVGGSTKYIVTIHDLIFLRYPECYPLIDRTIYDYKFKKACVQAHRIIAVSECTKRDIVQLYNIDPDKIDVVYQGCDEAFKHPVSGDKKEEVRKRYNLPYRYVFYVGSIERRKNLMLLAQAMTHLDESYRVVAVGKHTPYADEVTAYLKKNKMEHRMQMLHNVPFADLPALYQMATTFVYPSRYEGFGIPLLEALNSGVPAIGAHGSCLEEAGGPSSLYVAPDDHNALANAIRRTYIDIQLRQRMIAEGKEYALRFEPEPIARRLLDIYQSVCREG